MVLVAACSNAVTGQAESPSAGSPAVAVTSTTTTPPPKPLPGSGAVGTSVAETLVLGTNRLGIHQFNLETGYDPALIAQGVEVVLTSREPSGYGFARADVSGAQCPASRAITAGESFTCTVTISGQNKTVTVDIVSNLGSYIVGEPS